VWHPESPTGLRAYCRSVFFATNAANNAAADYDHIEVRPLTGALGAEITGVDLGDCSDEAFAEIRRASVDHLVVFFRDQSFDLDGFEAFGARWGPFGDDPFVAGLDSHPHIVKVLKEADEKHPLVFGGAWHSDWSFQERPPAFTILYGHEVPDHGGDTLWSNLYLAADHLSPGLRATLEGLRAVHSPQRAYGAQATHNELVEHMQILYGEAAHLKRAQPILRRHPDSGRTALYVNWGYTESIEGWWPNESQPLLDLLFDIATNPVYTCRFRWEPGSIAVWDNRCTLHNPMSDYAGQRREMWRMTIEGEEAIPGS
jgi:taurine dioxygenase